jgi:hypothetical protein
VNEDFYGHQLNVAMVLEGGLERPKQFSEFYATLSEAAGEKPPRYPPGGIFADHVPVEKPSASGWVPPRDKWQNQAPPPASGWVPPRDKWQNQAPPPASGWVPPREKWQNQAQSAPPAGRNTSSANPFVEVPGGVVQPLDSRIATAQPTADESFFGEEADESEEFVV